MKHHFLLAASLVVGSLAVSTSADTLDWVGGNGAFFDTAQWNPQAQPTSSDTIRFSGVGTVSVTSTSGASITSMSLSNSDVSFDFGAASLELSGAASVSCTAAYADTPALRVSGGTLSIGGRATFEKRAIVDVKGANTTLKLLGDQAIIQGSAMLSVFDGGDVTNSASVNLGMQNDLPGGIIVSNGSWTAGGAITLGGNAKGACFLHVLGGGWLDHSKVQRLSANSYSSVVVDGAGSLLKANQLAMQNSHATITIRNGGQSTASWCFWLGRGGNTYSNTLEVLDGGRAQGPVWFGYDSENSGWPSSNNTVRVSNGTLDITGKGFNLRDECNLVLQGTNTTVTVDTGMRVFRGARLIFHPPVANALAHAPLAVKGAITQIDADCSFIVDADAALLCAKSGGGAFTVATMTSDTTVQFANVIAPPYVTVTQEKRAIRVTVDNLGPTLVLFR